MIQRIVYIILLFVFADSALAQENTVPRQANLSVGISHTVDSVHTIQARVGITSHSDTLCGVQVGLLTSVVRQEMTGFNIGGISSISSNVKGVQASGFANISRKELTGLQIAGISNIAMGMRKGVQLSAMANVNSGMAHGLQLSTYNYSDTIRGLQLGLFNVCVAHPHGTQIGLVNYSRDTVAHKFGLVDINPNTDISLMTYIGNNSKFNAAFRFRNKSTYSIIGLGTHYVGLSRKFSGALSYRIGQYFHLSPRWTMSGDVGFSHVETFEEHSSNKPQRLYSLTANASLDYQFNRRIGAFVSTGYSNTRYYSRSRKWRDKMILESGLIFALNPMERSVVRGYGNLVSEEQSFGDERVSIGQSSLRVPSKHPWRAAAEVFAVNAFVNRFDAWVLNEDYAKINIHTIKSNFRHAFVWDNDNFSTNLFAHPYHGNLYFNSARSNGMSFFQSLPYALGGSLMWEFFGEDTPPAINDLMATTIGGSCIGEVAYRVSNLAYDDRERGFSRFMREMLGFVVNPMRGFNRLMTGEAWRVRPDGNDYHDFKQLPIGVSLSAGTRYIADNNSLFRGEHLPYVDFILDYGNPFCEETNKPYDYFNANITFGLGSRQPVISNIHLLGRIWNASVYETDDMELDFGLFQHFNFYNSEPVKDGSDIVPFRISEAAAIGPGVIYQFRNIGNLSQLEQRIFVDAILLGGSMSDYLRVQERDYNMGSGYSVKLQTMLEFGRYGSFRLNTGFYQIFTWKGYDADYIASMDNQNYSNTQGDVGNSALLVVNPRVSLHVWNHFNFNLQGSYYFRRTYYRHHLNVHARTFEFRAGLSFDI